MKVQIMTDTKYGNGKLLAEALKQEFSNEYEVKIADVKDLSPQEISEDVPDVIILGGAIRIFRADPKSKKWLNKLNKILEKSEVHKKLNQKLEKIKYRIKRLKEFGIIKLINKSNNLISLDENKKEILTKLIFKF